MNKNWKQNVTLSYNGFNSTHKRCLICLKHFINVPKSLLLISFHVTLGLQVCHRKWLNIVPCSHCNIMFKSTCMEPIIILNHLCIIGNGHMHRLTWCAVPHWSEHQTSFKAFDTLTWKLTQQCCWPWSCWLISWLRPAPSARGGRSRSSVTWAWPAPCRRWAAGSDCWNDGTWK